MELFTRRQRRETTLAPYVEEGSAYADPRHALLEDPIAAEEIKRIESDPQLLRAYETLILQHDMEAL